MANTGKDSGMRERLGQLFESISPALKGVFDALKIPGRGMGIPGARGRRARDYHPRQVEDDCDAIRRGLYIDSEEAARLRDIIARCQAHRLACIQGRREPEEADTVRELNNIVIKRLAKKINVIAPLFEEHSVDRHLLGRFTKLQRQYEAQVVGELNEDTPMGLYRELGDLLQDLVDGQLRKGWAQHHDTPLPSTVTISFKTALSNCYWLNLIDQGLAVSTIPALVSAYMKVVNQPDLQSDDMPMLWEFRLSRHFILGNCRSGDDFLRTITSNLETYAELFGDRAHSLLSNKEKLVLPIAPKPDDQSEWALVLERGKHEYASGVQIGIYESDANALDEDGEVARVGLNFLNNNVLEIVIMQGASPDGLVVKLRNTEAMRLHARSQQLGLAQRFRVISEALNLSRDLSYESLQPAARTALDAQRERFKHDFGGLGPIDAVVAASIKWARVAGFGEIRGISDEAQTALRDQEGDVGKNMLYGSSFARFGFAPPTDVMDPTSSWRLNLRTLTIESPLGDITTGDEKDYFGTVLSRRNPGNKIAYETWKKQALNGTGNPQKARAFLDRLAPAASSLK